MNEIVDQERQRYYLTRLNKQTNCLERVDMLTGEVMVLGNPLRKSEEAIDHPSRYTLEVADAICQMIREGATLRKIAETQGFPSVPVIYRWKELHPDFGRRLDHAYRDQALYHIDKASEIAEEAVTLPKEDVPAYKLASDLHIKLAGRKDPGRWNDNIKISGDKDAPLRILVDTGIRRITDDGFDREKFDSVDAEFREIEQKVEGEDE